MDYHTNIELGRDTFAGMLREEDEHLVYVIAGALVGGPVDDALDYMTLPDDFDDEDREQVVANLRRIADAIEETDR